ncbi:MAG TPA: YajQ family cyclic di-GMP-binding protein [Candidatus Saccharimonadales bacterium]|nr:YajQ family cyclic di-GMP-binding protein [Candidatus Saccharimonadales bacterium]
MAKDFSFDVVSDFDAGEMTNAVDQAQRELSQRYDFKGTAAKLEFADGKSGVQVEGDSRNQIDAIIDVLQSKLIRRGISVKVLDLSAEPVESGTVVRRTLSFKKGLDQEKAKKLSKLIRDAYPKTKAQIQGEAVRVSSASKDDLQGVMALLKQQDLDFPLDFQNYR